MGLNILNLNEINLAAILYSQFYILLLVYMQINVLTNISG